MPNPYDPSRQAGVTRDDEHPFLTPNGYRIMQDRNRIMDAAPIAFPQYPPPGYAYIDGQIIPIAPGSGQPLGVPIHNNTYDEFGNPIFFDGIPIQPHADAGNIGEPVLQNILPSTKYPDPLSLGHTPMTSHFQSSLVVEPQATALRAIGKLLIQVSHDPSREPATGSAWIAGPSLIITSAHNLYDFSSGTWSTSIEFHPGFDYYSRENLPRCQITSCCIPKGYLQNPTTNDDIAMCFVDTNIGDIVGAQIPIRPIDDNDLFNSTPVSIVGYPAGSGFDFGKQMWQSKGDYLFGRSNGPGDDYAPVMATNFGGGASGCPWLIQDAKTNKWVSVGVTSAHAKLRYRKGEPNLMSLISPFLGSRLFDKLSDDHVFHEFDTA